MTEGTREKRRGIGGISTRGASWLAWSACTLSLLLLALSLLAIVLGWSTPLGRGWISWWEQAVSSIGIIGAPILGGLIASRQPHNPYGWLWLGFGLGLTFQHLAESYAAYALVVEPGSLPAPRTISQLLELGGPLALTLVPFLLLLFPTGHLPSRRWSLLAWITAISGAVLLTFDLHLDNPEEVGGTITLIVMTVVTSIFAAVVL
jgi:hypothetical protein